MLGTMEKNENYKSLTPNKKSISSNYFLINY